MFEHINKCDKVILCDDGREVMATAEDVKLCSIIVYGRKFSRHDGTEIRGKNGTSNALIKPVNQINNARFLRQEYIKRLSGYDWKLISTEELKKVYQIIEKSTIDKKQSRQRKW